MALDDPAVGGLAPKGLVARARRARVSRAFVKEGDDAAREELPELVVSPHRNLVTAEGLAQIEATLQRLERELTDARAANDCAALARAERDLRYWTRRRATAEPVETPPATAGIVRFGHRVVLETPGGGQRSYRIVGEDEADPSAGLISWVSPLAEQLLGLRVGDLVRWQDVEFEIVALS